MMKITQYFNSPQMNDACVMVTDTPSNRSPASPSEELKRKRLSSVKSKLEIFSREASDGDDVQNKRKINEPPFETQTPESVKKPKIESEDSFDRFLVTRKSKLWESFDEDEPHPALSGEISKTEENENNLLNYFRKADRKDVTPVKSDRILVQALVHTPPDVEKKYAERSLRTNTMKCETQKCLDFDEIHIADSPIKGKIINRTELFEVTDRKLRRRGKMVKSYKDESTDSENEGESSDERKAGKRIKVSTEGGKKGNLTGEIKVKPRKLAPLFAAKAVAVEEKSESVQDARKLAFLCSGLPESVRKIMNVEKSVNGASEYRGEYTFPKITHIGYETSSCSMAHSLSLSTENYEVKTFKTSEFSSLIENDVESTSRRDIFKKLSPSDAKNEILTLKKTCDINVSELQNCLKNMEKIRRKEGKGENGYLAWTEKYKPVSSRDVLGNAHRANILKNWVEAHKNKALAEDKGGSSDSSSENDFIDDSSDEDKRSRKKKSRNNVALILGPTGCGKTSSVYAVANELGFKVLEINCGLNRSGKRILNELLEATQSHRVKGQKKCGFKKMVKKKKLEKPSMSLILIEDADVILENQDDGYVSAINSLVSTSKRPLVFTAKDANSPHLAKFLNCRPLVLNFQYPNPSQIYAWMQLIAISEGALLEELTLKRMTSDTRKNLWHLQFLISSGRCRDNEMVKSDDDLLLDCQDLGKRSGLLKTVAFADVLNTNGIRAFDNSVCESSIMMEISDLMNNCLKKFIAIAEKSRNLREPNLSPELKDFVQNCTWNNQGAAACDYFPSLRSIARSERQRLINNSKRANRYFHYLRSVDIPITDDDCNLLCDVLNT